MITLFLFGLLRWHEFDVYDTMAQCEAEGARLAAAYRVVDEYICLEVPK